MNLKTLKEKQEEELRYKANSSSSLGGFDLGVFDDAAHQNLKNFIQKVREETVEAVVDEIHLERKFELRIQIEILKELQYLNSKQ